MKHRRSYDVLLRLLRKLPSQELADDFQQLLRENRRNDISRALEVALGLKSRSVTSLALSACAEDIVDLSVRKQFLSGPRSPLARWAGADHIFWTAGLLARGRMRNPTATLQLTDALLDVLKLRILIETTQQLEAGEIDLEITSNHEFVRRLLPVENQFRWVSLTLCSALTEVAKRQPWHGRLRYLTAECVSELVRYVNNSMGSDTFIDYAKRWGRLSTVAQHVAMALCVNPIVAQRRPDELLIAQENLTHPFLQVRGLAIPSNLYSADFALEQALLTYTKGVLGQQFGLFYEEVAETAVAAVAHYARSAKKPIHIPIPDSSNDGETDFALYSRQGPLILGEVKSYAPPQRINSVRDAIADLEEGLEQLSKRQGALSSGQSLEFGSSSASFPSAIGVLTVAHSYGGAIWRPGALKAISGSGRLDQAILPLTSLLVILATCDSLADLRDYVTARQQLLSMGVGADEELDLRLFIRDKRWRFAVSALPGSSLKRVVSRSLSFYDLRTAGRPSSGSQWLEWIDEHADRMTPPIGASG